MWKYNACFPRILGETLIVRSLTHEVRVLGDLRVQQLVDVAVMNGVQNFGKFQPSDR
jgi:hypothetical protein